MALPSRPGRPDRGFDAEQGWRHGVAHGADLLMQLALNEAVGRSQLDRILAAVATQVAPAGVYAAIRDSTNEKLIAMQPAVKAALEAVP